MVLFIAAQSKATDAFANESDTGLDFYCDERDLDNWLDGDLPVILVVSRANTGDAYRLSVKDYFANPSRRASRKAHFDKQAHQFDATACDALFRLAAPGARVC